MPPVPAKQKQPFCKPALTYDKQVDQLIARGMLVSDREKAKAVLRHYNYYRLSAYWLPFEVSRNPHQFRDGTSFDTVVALYDFDHALRMLVLEATSYVEVSVRSLWAYWMAHHHGTHAHMLRDKAKDKALWDDLLDDMKKMVGERFQREAFIQHHALTYMEELPAIWACCEVLSFGELSKWVENLNDNDTKRKIAATYNINNYTLESWLHHIVIIRNRCAHHSRLWNHKLGHQPTFPENNPRLASQFTKTRQIYDSLVILAYLTDIICPTSSWKKRLVSHLNTCPLDQSNMGFPPDWKTRLIWKV